MNILVSVRRASIAAALLFACSTAMSQDGTIAVPENAHAAYGGWDCNRGFVKTNDSCTPLEAPRNAYLSSSGASWYLDYSGGDWRCDSGSRKRGAACVAENIR